LIFLPTGILWPSDTPLYLPFCSFAEMMLIFNCELRGTSEVVAMALLVKVNEPFYAGRWSEPKDAWMDFEIQDCASVKKSIVEYAEAHKIKLKKLEQTWYDYDQKMMMTGWAPYTDPDDE
jgi:hypothetical protein